MCAASIAATSAANAQQQRLLLEEERMTPYSQNDLDHDWEFKIVRANTRVFRNPDTLRTLIDEEARAGWVMLEKFDDSRVRFKRPRSARAQDAQLYASGIDPYRTHYGMSPAVYTAIIVGASLAFAFAIMGFVFVMIAFTSHY